MEVLEKLLIILKAKNSIITQIRRFSIEGEVKTGEELRTKLLQELTQTESASSVAIGFIKEELKLTHGQGGIKMGTNRETFARLYRRAKLKENAKSM